jgi:OmpA-OmpF porin, OOP family
MIADVPSPARALRGEPRRGAAPERAAAVLAWLVAHGIDKKRLESKWLGLTMPIDDKSTGDGRRNNRRVEFQIVESTESTKPEK